MSPVLVLLLFVAGCAISLRIGFLTLSAEGWLQPSLLSPEDPK